MDLLQQQRLIDPNAHKNNTEVNVMLKQLLRKHLNGENHDSIVDEVAEN